MAQDNEIKNSTEQAEVKEASTPETGLNTTGSEPQMPVYEDYESHEIAGKPKKRFKKRYVALAVAVLAVGGYVISSINAAKNAVVLVQTKAAALGTIENVLSVSGTVMSAETKTYFSEVTAPVAEVNVKAGDKVSKGDVLFSYDNDALNLSKETAELAIKQAKGQYSSYYSGTMAADRKYAEGMTPQQINERMDAITAEIDAINYKITEKTNRMNRTLTDLQKTIQDVDQNGLADSTEGGSYTAPSLSSEDIRKILAGENVEVDNSENEEEQKKQEDKQKLSLQVQMSIYEVQYALQNDPEIQGWRTQITQLQEEQQHLQSAKASQVNPGTATSAKAAMDSTTINQEDAISKIEEAMDGVKSDYNGVVTTVSVVEGATVPTGTQTVTIANLDDVEVAVQISKSDLTKVSIGQQVDITINGKEYAGEITKISGTATRNANGVAVVDTTIKVKKPDSDIILGVEANNKIHAQKAENTLVLPYEYVQTDSEGDYVYVVDNGVVTRKNVTIGIASSTEAQILDGISAGDQIITSDYDNLTEGMVVVVDTSDESTNG